MISHLALQIVRGLNQIVDMNQKSKFALSFKFILQKIYFSSDTIDFVSEMRHTIIHKEFPSVENVKKLAGIVLGWCFQNFWKPLLTNNLVKFNLTRLQMLKPYFFKGAYINKSLILRAFDQNRVNSCQDKDDNRFFISLFEIDENFSDSENFNKNLIKIVKLEPNIKKKKIKKRQKKKLFQIKEINEEECENFDSSNEVQEIISDEDDDTKIFNELIICLNPTSNLIKRKGMKAEVFARKKMKWETKSILGKINLKILIIRGFK